MAVTATELLCNAILPETQNLTRAEHLQLGSFCVRLPPVTSAFSLFPCNPQPKSSRQLLPSYWKETCVMTDWFGVSLRSLTVDNLDSSLVSSVWPVESSSMRQQLVVSRKSALLLMLNLCHVVSPEASACGERFGLVSAADFRIGKAAKNKPHQHVAKWRALPSCERFGMKTCNERRQVYWQCCRVLSWIQSQSRCSFWYSCGMPMFLLRAIANDKTWFGQKRLLKLGCLFRASLLGTPKMVVLLEWPWQLLFYLFLETQNLTQAEHMQLGSFCVRLPPVTSAFCFLAKSYRQPPPVVNDWFGVSFLSLTVDNLDSSVVSSVWPVESSSMRQQLVVSQTSVLLLMLTLCHVVSPEASAPWWKIWFGGSSRFQNGESSQ